MDKWKTVAETLGRCRSQQADIETSSDEYARRFSGAAGEYFLRVQREITLSLLDPWKGCQVLDVGGGHGQLAVPLVRQGFDVTVAGSDVVCRERLDRVLKKDSFHFKVSDLLDLPFDEKSFDVVLAFRLLPHEKNWSDQVAEMCRVARHAVIVDYPDVRSFNLLSKSLFRVKKGLEKNTREFITFRRSEIIEEFCRNAFPRTTLTPQFFAPMVLHRLLRPTSLSERAEVAARVLGLTQHFGSPVILRATR